MKNMDVLLEAAEGPLPRGRKDLSRQEVQASQHGRMLAAITEAVAEKGFAAATVTDVIKRARVSRATFYESFGNKEDCFAAAYEAATEVLVTQVTRAVAAESGGLRGALNAGVRTYCALLAANPAAARALIVESAASPALRTARARNFAVWARMLEDLARDTGSPAPPLAGTAAVGAISHLLNVFLEEGRDLSTAAAPLAEIAHRLLVP
jgi:AcrR family transcriptional regulator